MGKSMFLKYITSKGRVGTANVLAYGQGNANALTRARNDEMLGFCERRYTGEDDESLPKFGIPRHFALSGVWDTLIAVVQAWIFEKTVLLSR